MYKPVGNQICLATFQLTHKFHETREKERERGKGTFTVPSMLEGTSESKEAMEL